MTHTTVGVIPGIPLSIRSLRSRHIHCSPDGKRVIYGATNGVVSRILPDQMDINSKVVESFIGCKKPVEIAAISPDNNVVIGGDNNGCVYVWTRSPEKGILKTYNLGMPYVRITDLAFSEDSQRLAVCGVDKYSKKLGLVIFTMAGSALGKLEGHTLGINSVTFRQKKPYVVATAGVDGLICLHSGPPFKLLYTCKGHVGQANCVRFAASGDQLISCGDDGRIFSWCLDTGDAEREIPVCEGALYGLAWSRNGERFVTVGVDNLLRIISFGNGEILDQCIIGSEVPESPLGIAWTATDWVVVSTEKGQIWGLKTDQQLRFFQNQHFLWQGMNGTPTVIGNRPISGPIAIGDTIGTIIFLSTKDTDPRAYSSLRLPSPSAISSIVIGESFGAVTSNDGFVRLFRLPDEKNSWRTGTTAPINSNDKLEDNTKLLKIKSSESTTFIRSVNTVANGKSSLLSSGLAIMTEMVRSICELEVAWVGCHAMKECPVSVVRISNDNAILVFCASGVVQAYPFKSAGNHFAPLWSTNVEGTITSTSVTVDGSLIALSLMAGERYHLEKFGDDRKSIDGSKHLVELYEIDDISAEGFRFVCVYELSDSDVSVNNLIANGEFNELMHGIQITCVALSPAGKYLACADVTRTIMVVEIETGERVIRKEWQFHASRITCLAWSPDGTKLASGSLDKAVYVWNIEKHTEKIHLKDAHLGGVSCVEFIFNNILLTAGNDGALCVSELEV